MNTQNYAFIFPGQGSQTIGMGKELAESFPKAKEIFNRSDEILGFPLTEMMWNGPEDQLNETLNTQPALLTHSIAALTVLQAESPELKPAFTAGHSMGELSALVASEALDFESGLLLARKRGELMKKAGDISPGSMAAIIGLDTATVLALCESITESGKLVQLANDNCPGQIVVSGDNAGIDEILTAAKEAGAKIAKKLAVSIAAHSQLMEPVRDEFIEAVEAAGITAPNIPIIGNVNANPLTTVEQIKADLAAQLNSQVRWTESIQFLIDNGVDTFVEVGTGKVLTNLVKRINRKTKRLAMGTPADLTKLQ